MVGGFSVRETISIIQSRRSETRYSPVNLYDDITNCHRLSALPDVSLIPRIFELEISVPQEDV